MRIGILILSILLVALPAHAGPTKEEILAQLFQEFGRPVDGARKLPIADFLQKAVDKLTATQRRTTHADVLLVNKLHIIESTDINAFVWTVKEPGRATQENHVFLTSGIIRKILEMPPNLPPDQAEAMRKRNLKRLIGVLLHEMGHPVDAFEDKFSLERVHGRNQSAQARELRADFDGTLLARNAEFPADAVYEAKEFLTNLARTNPSPGLLELLGAYASDHPDLVANQTVNRAVLTYGRLEQGKPSTAAFDTLVKTVSPADYASFEKLPEKRVDPFPTSSTLEAAIERLNDFISEHELQEHRSERLDDKVVDQLNRLVLDVERHLLAREGRQPLTSQEQNELILAFKRLMIADSRRRDYVLRGSLLYDEPELKERGLRDAGSPFAGQPGHRDAVEKLAFFQSPEYLKMIREEADSNRGEISHKAAEIMVGYLPARTFVAELPKIHHKLKNRFEHVERNRQEPRYFPNPEEMNEYEVHDMQSLPSDFARQSLPLQIELGAFLQKSSFLNQSEATRFELFRGAYLFDHDDGRSIPGLMLTQEKDPAKRALARQEVLDYLDKHADAAQSYRQTAQYLWDNRGKFSLLALARNGAVDWELVARLAGDPNPSGAEEAAHRAALDFVAGAGAESFFDWMASKKIKPELERALTAQDLELLNTIHAAAEKGGGSTARAAWMKGFSRLAIAMHDPQQLRTWYRAELRAELGAAVQTKSARDALAAAHTAAVQKVVGAAGPFERATKDLPLADILAEEIAALPVPAEKKREMLSAAFQVFDPALHRESVLGFTPATWLNGSPRSPDLTAKVVNVLTANGVLPSASAQLRALQSLRDNGLWKSLDKLRDTDKDLKHDLPDKAYQTIYPHALDGLADPLIAEIRGARTPDELIHLAMVLSPAAKIEERRLALTGSRRLADVQKALIETARRLGPSDQWLGLFRLVAEAGATPQTDAFLVEQVLPQLGAARLPILAQLLEARAVYSTKRQVAFAREFLEASLGHLEGKPVTADDLKKLVDRLDQLVPERSAGRDEFLEDIAWRLHLSQAGELNFIESAKASNLRTLSPKIASWASLGTKTLVHLDDAARTRLMTYLMDPKRRPFTKQLEEDLRGVLRKVVQKERLEATVGRKWSKSIDEAANERYEELQQALIRYAEDSSELERVPVLDILLNLGDGKNDVARSGDERRRVLSTLLGVDPGSDYGKSLLTYLDLIPEHERSMTLAYLMAHAGNGEASFKDFFLAFRGAGIRAGQQSVLWDLIRNARTAGLEDLFDRARPQTLAEISAELRKRFPNRQFRIKRRLGSATSLTAVEVEWDAPKKGGGTEVRRAALLVRRPYALEQLESHFELGQEYIRRLRAQGLQTQARFVEQLLEAQHEQMRQELDFGRVADNLDRLRESVEGRGARSLPATPGVNFRVPKVYRELGVSEDLIFVELGEGETFQRASDPLKAKTGEPLAKLLSHLLFRGAYQANPSPGNFLVSEGKDGATVWLIDGGQIGQLGSRWLVSDESYRFAQFLRALSEGDAKGVLDGAIALGATVPAGVDRAQVEREVSAALRSGPLGTGVRAALDVFASHGIQLDPRFTFNGGLKTILEMMNSGIVTPDRMRELIAESARRKIQRQPLAVVGDALAKAWQHCLRGLGGVGHGQRAQNR